jgi:hypothetical protein
MVVGGCVSKGERAPLTCNVSASVFARGFHGTASLRAKRTLSLVDLPNDSMESILYVLFCTWSLATRTLRVSVALKVLATAVRRQPAAARRVVDRLQAATRRTYEKQLIYLLEDVSHVAKPFKLAGQLGRPGEGRSITPERWPIYERSAQPPREDGVSTHAAPHEAAHPPTLFKPGAQIA